MTAEQLIIRKIWRIDPKNSPSVEFSSFVASEELLSLTHPPILASPSLFLSTTSLFSSCPPQGHRWSQTRVCSRCLVSAWKCKTTCARTVQTLFTQQLFTTLSVCYYGFVPSVVPPRRPPLPPRPQITNAIKPAPTRALKSPAAADKGWRIFNPCAHQQPLGAHAHVINATGYNSEVFQRRVYFVCTCAFNMCHNWALNGPLMSDLFSGSLAALTGWCPHSEENKQASQENGPKPDSRFSTVVQMCFIVKTSSIRNGCCCELRIKFRTQTPQEKWTSERTEALLSV